MILRAVADMSFESTLEPVVDLTTVAGRLLLPTADRVITPALSRWRVWEAAETRFLQATLGPGQTFVDVGAHVGYFSVLAAKLVGLTGRVIAVEPERRNLDLLYRNLARNGCRTAAVVPCAAGSAPGRVSLALDEDNRGGHRLVAPGDEDGDVFVSCVRLDDVLPTQVDVIKIDVQGYDHEVIAGLRRTIASNPNLLLIVEFSREELVRRGVDRAAVLASYEELDFAFGMFDSGGKLRGVTAGEVLAASAGPHSPTEFSLVLERPETPPFSPSSHPAWVDGLKVEETADGLIVVQPAREQVHRLNVTSSVIFDLCTGERSVGAIVGAVQELYELFEPPTAEVHGCLDRLRRATLLK